MALQFGLNLPASNIKKILEQNDKQQSGIRSWRQLFGGASQGFNARSDMLTTDYSSAMAEAYKANFEKNMAIMSGGLSGQQINYKDLQDTYEKFIGNYNQNLAAAAENYGKEVGAIDAALTERAEKMANVLNYALQYGRDELFGSTLNDEQYFKAKGLDWLLDENGEMLTEEELNKLLFDENGALTERGIAYFDALMNTTPQGYKTIDDVNTRSFDKWLSDTDADLREWWIGQDDFNYTFAGTNLGTINTLLGRESIDSKYERPEYDVLLNAKTGGYDKMRKTVQDKVWNTLENRGRDGIKTISDIGTRKKKYEGQLKSYDEWFKDIETKGLNVPNTSNDLRASNTMASYIEDYKRYSSTELTTLKSELNTLLGEKYAKDFWNNYGEEVDRLFAIIQGTSVAELSKNPLIPSNMKHNIRARQNYENATKLRNLGFDKAMQKLYKDLETYIGREYRRIESERRKISGF